MDLFLSLSLLYGRTLIFFSRTVRFLLTCNFFSTPCFRFLSLAASSSLCFSHSPFFAFDTLSRITPLLITLINHLFSLCMLTPFFSVQKNGNKRETDEFPNATRLCSQSAHQNAARPSRRATLSTFPLPTSTPPILLYYSTPSSPRNDGFPASPPLLLLLQLESNQLKLSSLFQRRSRTDSGAFLDLLLLAASSFLLLLLLPAPPFVAPPSETVLPPWMASFERTGV